MTYQFESLLILKVGTNVLVEVNDDLARFNDEVFESIGGEVRQLSDAGNGIILVTSGAITAGVLVEKRRREEINCTAEEQRYAARGWDIIVQKWKAAIGRERVSSILLTRREMHIDTIRKKLLKVIACCLRHGDIFIVNENDCLSDNRIRFGDNDTLAAALAIECASSYLAKSVKLIMLTNRNGLNKAPDDDSTLIRTVKNIDLIERYAGNSKSNHSRGGMKTKVRAAKAAKLAGVEAYIANGKESRVVGRTIAREIGTYFSVEK